MVIIQLILDQNKMPYKWWDNFVEFYTKNPPSLPFHSKIVEELKNYNAEVIWVDNTLRFKNSEDAARFVHTFTYIESFNSSQLPSRFYLETNNKNGPKGFAYSWYNYLVAHARDLKFKLKNDNIILKDGYIYFRSEEELINFLLIYS